jgi:hypothetical protein
MRRIMGIMGSAMGGAVRSAMRSGVLGIRRGVVRGWVSVDRSRGIGGLMERGRGVSVWGKGLGVGSRGIRCRGVRGLMVRCRGGVLRSIRGMGCWVRGTKVGVSLRFSVGQGDGNDGGDNLKEERDIFHEQNPTVRRVQTWQCFMLLLQPLSGTG